MSDHADLANYAEALRNNPLLTAFLKDMHDDCVATWAAGSNPQQREEQWHRLQVVKQFQAKIQSIIDGAKLTAAREDRARRAPR